MIFLVWGRQHLGRNWSQKLVAKRLVRQRVLLRGTLFFSSLSGEAMPRTHRFREAFEQRHGATFSDTRKYVFVYEVNVSQYSFSCL
jgi:hypothetical protein